MAIEVATLQVAIDAAMDKFDKELGSVDSKLGKVGGVLGKVAGGVAIAGTAAVAAGGALMAMAHQTGAAADEIDKMAIRTGLSRQQLQELQFAAGQTGVEFSSIERASARMAQSLRTNEAAFAALGVETRNASGEIRSSDELFNETIRSLAAMDNEMERNIAGQELFGRGFTEMIPLIDAGADGLDAYADRAHELGAVLSDDAIAANVKYMDTMDEVKTMLQGAFMHTMTAILPILQSFLDWIMGHMPEIQATVSKVMTVVSDVVTKAFAIFETYVMPVLETIYNWVQENLPKMQGEFNERFETIQRIIGNFVEAVTLFWDRWGGTIMKVVSVAFDYIKTIIGGALDIVLGVMETFSSLMVGDWEGVVEGIKRALSGLKNIIMKPFEDAWKGITGITDKIKESMNKLNPFARSSPSLVDNVRMGVDVIANEYKGLNRINFPSANDAMGGTAIAGGMNLAGSGGGTASIYFDVDGRTMAKIIGQPLTDEIRLKTGMRL